MKVVHKFELYASGNPENIDIVSLPATAKILTVKKLVREERIIHMWVLLETEDKYIDRKFVVAGMGHDLDHLKIKQYIGTVVDNYPLERPWVWHVFEIL